MAYNERTAVEPLRRGETVEVRGVGNSMTPLLTSGQTITMEPVTSDTELKKGDVVLAKVNGRHYMHKITGLRGDLVQISNNHGHVNGWTSRSNVFGLWRR